MAFSNGYTIGFATAICLVCSLGVASASLGLKPRIVANKKMEFQRSILTAVGLGEEAGKTEDVGALYNERIQPVYVNGSGTVLDASSDQDGDNDLDYADVQKARKDAKGTGEPVGMYPVFQRKDGNTIGAYAFEMRGKGLWGPISGFLAVKPDGRTVLGATFDAPKETPGLGAEIMKEKFRGQFAGKRIVNDAGELVPIQVVKGSAELLCQDAPQHCVDGLSGATITANGVSDMVDEALSQVYKDYLQQIQSGTGG
jgi:Na+-transporting NADH:ubiquinone oxidoreductase subunit C